MKKYIEEEGLKNIKAGVGSIGKGLKGIKETYYNSIEVLNLMDILDDNIRIYFMMN